MFNVALKLRLVDLNFNFACDWLVELSITITIEEIVNFMIISGYHCLGGKMGTGAIDQTREKIKTRRGWRETLEISLCIVCVGRCVNENHVTVVQKNILLKDS